MKHWIQAFRLRTLPLAASSIIVGSALAVHVGHFRWSIFALALLTALLLQILSNLANDLGDHQHGTDNADRVGPQRAVQRGAISPEAMKRAMFVCGGIAFLSGCLLITVALGFTLKTLLFLGIGLLAIGAAVKYTFGSNPYGYAGFGDISVFLFFGVTGVCGTFFLHAHTFDQIALLPAISFGLLSTGVLNLNNMRDIVNDAASGKRTLVVRMGSAKARFYHILLIGGGIACLTVFTLNAFEGRGRFQFILITAGLLIHLARMLGPRTPDSLDPELKRLALSTFFSALMLSGFLWSHGQL